MLLSSNILIMILTGIAAANYCQAHHFPNRTAYDAFYEILLRITNIAFVDLATYAQERLVTFATMYSSIALSVTRRIGHVRVAGTAFVTQPMARPTTI
jgi:hypothetical protein